MQVHAPASPGDGRRVLVERLWPRGLRKEAAGVDLWLKEVAPGHALRRWFHEAPDAAAAPLAELRGLAERGRVTLLFTARDDARNSAVVLQAVLDEEAER